MKAITLLLVFVAYGDSPDYFPAAVSPSEPAAGKRSSTFAADTEYRQAGTRGFDPYNRANQQYSKQRAALPKPLGMDRPVRQATGTTGSDFNRVRAAQFDMGREDRGVRPVDFDMQPTTGEATNTADGARPFALSASGQSANTEGYNPTATRNSSVGKRYIPANANVAGGGLPNNESSFPTGSNFDKGTTSNFDRDGGLTFDTSRTNGTNTTRPDSWANQPDNSSVPTVTRRQPANAARPVNSPGAVDVPPPTMPATTSTVSQPYAPPTQAAPYGAGSQTGTLSRTNQNTTSEPPWQRLAENTKDAASVPAATAVDAPQQALPTSTSAAYPAVRPSAGNAQRYADAIQSNYPQPVRPGGSFMTTMLALFGSIGLNLYLGWVAWDTYNRYQDLVHDVRYTGSRRDSSRDEYASERVVEAAY